MYRLIQSLVRPYWGILAIILAAMVLQTAASVAGPWPLKIIPDNVVGSHKLPLWLDHLLAQLLSGTSEMLIAAAAAMAAVLIAVVGAIASYVANYYTTSVQTIQNFASSSTLGILVDMFTIVAMLVMLNPARRSGQSKNAETHKKSKAAGIAVIDSNPAFDVTHEKSMVVKSLNWDIKNLTETRDYAVVTTHEPEVKEVIECFERTGTANPLT